MAHYVHWEKCFGGLDGYTPWDPGADRPSLAAGSRSLLDLHGVACANVRHSLLAVAVHHDMSLHCHIDAAIGDVDVDSDKPSFMFVETR